MSQPVLTGSCLCGAVRYELTAAPVWSHICHCSRCRKATGSGFAANLFFPLEALRFTRGEELLGSFAPPEAERFKHVFCSICGSTLPYRNESRNNVLVPMGSLDADPEFTPRAHIFVDSKAPWVTIGDELPQHPYALGSAKPPDD